MWALALWMFPLLYRLSLAALPHKPENISCIFYYKHNLTCTWSPTTEAKDTWYTVKRILCHEKERDMCTNKTETSCFIRYPNVTNPDDYTIEVEAKNADGIVKSDRTHWCLDSIVKIEPPKIDFVKPVLGVKQMVQVQWERPKLAPVSSTLICTLRFKTVNNAEWKEVNFSTEDIHLKQVYNLTDLQAFTEYVIALRCMAEGSQFWSDWSQEKMGTTEEQAPFGLDLWRVLRPLEADGRRPVQLLWKEARRGPILGKAIGYTIWYFPENSTYLTETMNTTNEQLELYLGSETYWVSVVSYNSFGKSPEATLRIPSAHEKPFPCIEAMQAFIAQDQLVVEWQSSASLVDTWMVEWFPDLDSEPSALSWEFVSQARNWTIPQDKLEPFLCYNISVYPLFQDLVGEPYSVQAYVKEGVPLAGPVTKAENIAMQTVTITWKEIPKSQRSGFISNYTIFYQAEDGEEFSKTVDSSILQYDLKPLTRNTPYTVQVMASTRAGGTNGTRINFKTLSISFMEIGLIASLVGGGLLIFIILTVAYGLKKPNKLKHLCWPDVPNPAESSLAMWCGDDFKNKLNLKEVQFDNSVNTEEDSILKPHYGHSDLIDKLVVNFGNFLEEVSIEKPLKHKKNIAGGEKNEYVTSLYTPDYPLGKNFQEPPISAKILSRMPEETCSETKEQLLSYGQNLGPDQLCEEGTPNLYLKNSVTTREFLVSEKLPDQTKKEV
ncbi:PREDICTED: interleukin-31 receptor subunit alpha [Chrysochloris asiatica]|uniref:Interleukin-31 receptor subunit alpha n=1 Tax=Chrysochloris asiatica TaxID=185453 RepID=A0A9B0X141_CHRAS|nr:PREDICTED: interleukin-31 receptor subunit alpha [Chrysochloris asiatica]